MTSAFQDALSAQLAKEFTGRYRADLGAVTASSSHGEIAAYVESLVAGHLGVAPAEPLFVEKSIGVVFGVKLKDERKVVLKLFSQALTSPQLTATLGCLEHLVRAGYPATPAVSVPFVSKFGQLGCFFSFGSGELRTGHEPLVRRTLAKRLAEFTSIVEELDPSELPAAPGHHAELWQTSHRSFLRFDASRDVAWIDDVAARAQAVLMSSGLRKIPAHLDWGAKNARFSGDELCTVFDWDSLCQASEAHMVGRAAAQFTAQWDLPANVVPSAAEAMAFVEEYEEVRSRRFAEDEWRVITASAEYLTATIARLEAAHAVPPRYGFLERLRRLGETPMFSRNGA